VNPLKGAGVVLLFAAVVVLMTSVPNQSVLILGLSVMVVVFSTITYAASVRRRRRDRRAAGD
jgi:hypothetical protein